MRYSRVNNCAFTPPSVSTRSPYLEGQVRAPLARTIDCFPVLEVTTVCKHDFRSVASTISTASHVLSSTLGCPFALANQGFEVCGGRVTY